MICESGYVNTSISEICNRAGVSRGALLHHYPTKVDLIVDAAASVWQAAIDEVRTLTAALSRGEMDSDAFFEGVWERVFRRDAVEMTVDLLSASKSDRQLQAGMSGPLAALMMAYDEIAEDAFPKTGLSHNQRRVLITMTLCAARGLRMQEMMHPDPAMTQAAKAALKLMIDQLLNSGAGPLLIPEPANSQTGTPRGR